jgi:hypothetical protein
MHPYTTEWLITAMKGPTFWMSLMEYMQLPAGIFPRDMMNLSCAEDIYEAYAAVELSGTCTRASPPTNPRTHARTHALPHTHTH